MSGLVRVLLFRVGSGLGMSSSSFGVSGSRISVFTRVPNPGWVPGFLEKSGLGFLNLKTRVPGFLYFLEFFL